MNRKLILVLGIIVVVIVVGILVAKNNKKAVEVVDVPAVTEAVK